MRILIIEDELLVARDIQHHIARIEPEAEIVGILTSVESSNRWFDGHAMPDLILSDIQLSDGIAFDIFESRNITCPIIFTTAYDDYAIRAFKLNSIDYLLKPVDPVELTRALHKYKLFKPAHQIGDQLSDLIHKWNSQIPQFKERFLVVHGNSQIPVSSSEIAFFHKEQLIFLHNIQNEKFICEYNALDEVEELVDPKYFFRVNRQYIIHIQAVGKVKSTHKGLSLSLKPPFMNEIDISREKAVSFKKWLG
jgi:two-component system, LytTR family, response regulator